MITILWIFAIVGMATICYFAIRKAIDGVEYIKRKWEYISRELVYNRKDIGQLKKDIDEQKEKNVKDSSKIAFMNQNIIEIVNFLREHCNADVQSTSLDTTQYFCTIRIGKKAKK